MCLEMCVTILQNVKIALIRLIFSLFYYFFREVCGIIVHVSVHLFTYLCVCVFLINSV